MCMTILKFPCFWALKKVKYERIRRQHSLGKFCKGSCALSISSLPGRKRGLSTYFKEGISYRELEAYENRDSTLFVQEIITGKKNEETTTNNLSCL